MLKINVLSGNGGQNIPEHVPGKPIHLKKIKKTIIIIIITLSHILLTKIHKQPLLCNLSIDASELQRNVPQV